MKHLSFFFFTFCYCAFLHAGECQLKLKRSYLPKYARYFKISYYEKFKIIESDGHKYLLADTLPDCSLSVDSVVKTPVSRVAFMSTTYLPALEMLAKSEALIAFQGKQFILSKKIHKEKVKDLSFKFNPEDLLNLKADLIMGYTGNLTDDKQNLIFKQLHLPVVINKDFEENAPLARAEWLVFISSFFNLEEKAISLFREIEFNYLELKKQNTLLPKVSVLIGSIDNGYWSAPGGRSVMAQLVADAGGELAYANNKSETQRIPLEVIFQNSQTYEVWLSHNEWISLEERLKKTRADTRYKYIKAKRVYNNNLIRNENGATDFWENGLQRPDLLLRDLSNLFHPEHYSNVELKWYRKI